MVRPSEVDRFDFRNSEFQKGEKEAWAIFFLKMCLQNGDTFEQEFEWQKVGDFVENLGAQETIHSVYKGMYAMAPLRDSLFNNLAVLIQDGFIAHRKEGEGDDAKIFLKVTEKMVAFYETYGAQPAN